MILQGGVTIGEPTRFGPTGFLLRSLVALVVASACAVETPRPDDEGEGGAPGAGGKPVGKGGSGGAKGGAVGAGGGSGGGVGNGGSIGSGGSMTAKGGTTGSGGSGRGGTMGGGGSPPPDGPPPVDECPKTNPPRFCSVELMLVNCQFCHEPTPEDEILKADFTEGPGLYERLVNKPIVAKDLANCSFKTLVVPGKPEQSLLYLKLAAGTMPNVLPANCGIRMPAKAKDQLNMPPPFTAMELKAFYDWIAGGAVK